MFQFTGVASLASCSRFLYPCVYGDLSSYIIKIHQRLFEKTYSAKFLSFPCLSVCGVKIMVIEWFNVLFTVPQRSPSQIFQASTFCVQNTNKNNPLCTYHQPPPEGRFSSSALALHRWTLYPPFSPEQSLRGERGLRWMHPHILQREKQQARRELTGDHADRQAGRQTHNRQWCCQSFPPASLWISALTFIIKHTCSCHFHFKSLGKSHKWSVRIQSCHFQNDSFWELN